MVKIFSVPSVFPCMFQIALGCHRRPSSILARHGWTRKSLLGQGTRPFVQWLDTIT